MKRTIVYPLAFALFFCAHHSSFGQTATRKIDLRVVVADSIAGKTFVSPGKEIVVAYIINQGPDSIYANDRFATKFYLGNAIYPIKFPFAPFDMGVGDSLMIWEELDMVYNINLQETYTCAYARMTTQTKDSLIKERIFEEKDNKGCVQISHISNYPTSTANAAIKKVEIYPNPATNNIIVAGFPLNAKYRIYNSIGREVYSGIITSEKQQITFTKALSNGTYIFVTNDKAQLFQIVN